jgi:hypothetical protein
VPRAIIALERDPEVLAQKARTRMRRKIAQLREALDCSFFTGDHAFALQMKLDNIDHNTAQIAVLDERIAVMSEPYERQVARLAGLPVSASPTGSSTSISSVRAVSMPCAPDVPRPRQSGSPTPTRATRRCGPKLAMSSRGPMVWPLSSGRDATGVG